MLQGLNSDCDILNCLRTYSQKDIQEVKMSKILLAIQLLRLALKRLKKNARTSAGFAT